MDKGGESAIHRSRCQHLRRVHLCSVSIQRRWQHSCSNIQLDRLVCHTDEEDSGNQDVSPLQDVILFTWWCVCKGIQWFSKSHSNYWRYPGLLMLSFTTWTKRWLSVVFVWLHPTVFPRWWQRHCLPTATNPEVSCQQRGYSKPWPHRWQTSFTTQNMLRVLGSTLGIDGGAHFRFRRLWMAEYLYTTSSLTEGPSSSYEHSLQSTKWKET